MKEVTIYTDGACSVNPGPGGWGCVLIYKGVEKEFSGFEDDTTNNRMEMRAVIEALERLKEPCKIDIYSDSAYVVNAFLQDWVSDWQKKNWRTANNKPVKNVELWQQLINLTKQHSIKWHKVKGHSTDVYNNRCDELARGEVDRFLLAKNKNTIKF